MSGSWSIMLWTMAMIAMGSPADSLEPMPRRFYEEGLSLEAAGELQRAELRFRTVMEMEPGVHQVVLDLGRVLLASGAEDEAEVLYRQHVFDADIVEALGWLYLDTGRPELAVQRFRDLQTLTMGQAEPFRLEAIALAQIDPLAASARLALYLGLEGVQIDSGEVDDAVVDVARGLHEAGELEQALALIEQRLSPDAEQGTLTDLYDALLVEEEAAHLVVADPQSLSPVQRRDLESAREDYAAGRIGDAEQRLVALSSGVPRNAQVWAALADVREQQGRIEEAERCLRWATAYDPLDPAHLVRLGDLLTEHYAHRFDVEAAGLYRRAIRRGAAEPAVWSRMGHAELRGGLEEQGLASLSHVLGLVGDGDVADKVGETLSAYERSRPDLKERATPALVPTPIALATAAARVWFEGRGDYERALSTLKEVREAAPNDLEALRLDASIRMAMGERSTAEALYRRMLEIDPGQPDVLLLLADIVQKDKQEEAKELVRRSAMLGGADAWYRLARDAWSEWRIGETNDALDAYFRSATSGVHYADAEALLAEVERWKRIVMMTSVGSVGVVVGIPFLLWYRRSSSYGLAELLLREPSAWRDVARICSAIRHDVLKHNTTTLAAVADSLEAGDWESGAWVAERLFSTRGPVMRFRQHVHSLELLGRVHGVRLDLSRRDPVLGPLVNAFRRLTRLKSSLITGGTSRQAEELREISHQINQVGYRGLGLLLDQLCVLDVTSDLIDEVWGRVRQEAAFGCQDVELIVTLPPGPNTLRIFRHDLDDVLANLLRNALAATIEVGGSSIAVVVETEGDDITGIERLAIRVADAAPNRLSTALIRSRYIEKGLGLVVDSISRNGGSIHVESQPGWTKAVVVRFPRVETPVELEGEA